MYLVNVLISTYNGEQYIKEQIDSILNQTYKNIRIYVRDDGSKDGSLAVLKEYEARGEIILIEGKNAGYGPSFMTLLQESKEGDFWAFCDQDDVWEKDKIKNAVEKIRTLPQDQPAFYFHNFSVTDEQLNEQYIYRYKIPGYGFSMAITECIHLGFATMMNGALRDLMLLAKPEELKTHDWWTELIAMEFANIYEDDYVGAKHRRLDISVSSNNFSTRAKWFFKALKGNAEISNITALFLEKFGNQMDKKDRKVLEWFVGERYSLIKSIRKACYPKRWRSSMSSELVLRFLMLIGRI